jgi:beta-galactosidase
MPTPEWVEACDRMGMMMMCETRLMSSNPEGMAQLETMVKRYRNSPSIILWSMGNEEWTMMPEPQGVRVIDDMIARTHELDPTRLCSAAVNGSFESHFPERLDVMGYNYNLKAHDPWHKDHPKKPSVGSETASTIATRGIYTTDKLRNWISAYDLNHTAWSQLAEEWWKFYAAREWLSGGFAWTGFDYRGEPTPYGWPSISSQFGIVDMCGFPKDNFFYYKAWWGSEPVLHLFPHWDWDQRLGEPISVWVHSNLDSVEVFLNGKSHGSKKIEALTHLEWKVPYEPGVLEARGTKGGKAVLTEKRETTGDPVAIRLTPDRTEINADGEDLAILRVEALDKEGRAIPTADYLLSFKVTGEGILLGVGNGDPNCQESDKGPRRSLFSGLAQVIVQSSKTPGTITVEAYTGDWPPPKLPSTQVTITTKKTEPRASVG